MNNLNSADFYKPSPYNSDTLNQIWMSTIADSHDIWCNCTGPFAHLLASIFPPGHKDRDLTINQIIQRDYKQQCHSGGGNAADVHGLAATAEDIKPDPEGDEEDFQDEGIDAILAAAATSAEER